MKLDLFSDEKYQTAAARALAFIKGQFDVNNYIYKVYFSEDYGDDWEGVLAGYVEGDFSEYSYDTATSFNFSSDYDYDYSGTVSGTCFTGATSVTLYVSTDAKYEAGTVKVYDDGSFTSERYFKTVETYVDGVLKETKTTNIDWSKYTTKVIVVVTDPGTKDSDTGKVTGYTEQVTYCSTEAFEVPSQSIKTATDSSGNEARPEVDSKKIQVRLYVYSDTEYLNDTVSLYMYNHTAGQTKAFFYSNKIHSGHKVAKVLKLTTTTIDVPQTTLVGRCSYITTEGTLRGTFDTDYGYTAMEGVFVGEITNGEKIYNTYSLVPSIKPKYISSDNYVDYWEKSYVGTCIGFVDFNALKTDYLDNLYKTEDDLLKYFFVRCYTLGDAGFVKDTDSEGLTKTSSSDYRWYTSSNRTWGHKVFALFRKTGAYDDDGTFVPDGGEEQVEWSYYLYSTNALYWNLEVLIDNVYQVQQKAQVISLTGVATNPHIKFYLVGSCGGGGKKYASFYYIDPSSSTETSFQVVGITGNIENATIGALPASFKIPTDDPQYDKDGSTAQGVYGYLLNSRTWAYDVGLSMLVFATSGEYDYCKKMMERMYIEQNADGSFNFSYDIYIGQLFEDYVRTGAMGWFVWGACYYVLVSGDRDSRWIEMLKNAGTWLLGRQITDENDDYSAGNRYGLLTGGYGSYNMDDYSYVDTYIEWCSTEHNCSALQALWGLSLVLGNTEEADYATAAIMVQTALMTKMWNDAEKRFNQGINDTAWALDCTTWAGAEVYSAINDYYCKWCRETAVSNYLVTNAELVLSTEKNRYNQIYSSGTTFDGFKPYSDNTPDYKGAPDLVWSEGTLGYIILCLKIGKYAEAVKYMDEMVKLQNIPNCTGGLLYVTATYGELPWEFHTWESVVSSAWLYLTIKNPYVLFPTTMRVPLYKAEFTQISDRKLWDLSFVAGRNTYFIGETMDYQNWQLIAEFRNEVGKEESAFFSDILDRNTANLVLSTPYDTEFTKAQELVLTATFTHADVTMSCESSITISDNSVQYITISVEPTVRFYTYQDIFTLEGIKIVAITQDGVVHDITDVARPTSTVTEGTRLMSTGNKLTTFNYTDDYGNIFYTSWTFTVSFETDD